MSFYTEVLQKDPRFNLNQDIRDLNLLEPVTRAAVQSIIADAASHGIQLIVTETFRSAARQQALFAQKKTKLDGLTPESIGVHHFGLACDFARIQNGVTDWSTADWLFLGAFAAKYGMTWGGDWGIPAHLHTPGFHDWDHIQNCTVAQQQDLFAGGWYPTISAQPALSSTPLVPHDA